MTDRLPADPDTERVLLGTMLRTPHACEAVLAWLNPEDFYVPSHGALFAVLAERYRHGETFDPHALVSTLSADTLRSLGDRAGLVDLIAGSSAASAAGALAVSLYDLACRRQAILAVAEMAEGLKDTSRPVAEIVDLHRANLDGIGHRTAGLPDDLWSLDDFLDRPEVERAEWVVPGLMRKDWRCVIVAPEGAGKSQLYRQLAVCAGQGIHPLDFSDTWPVVTLLVDLENPDQAIVEGCRPIKDAAVRAADTYTRDRAFLWHRPGGLNLRNRRDRHDFEAVLAHVQPDLVTLGPLYKAYRRSAGETDEQAADGLQQVLDDLRTRYRFGLLLEHHAPKKQGGHRDLEPFGSSLWLRWPELGFGLVPQDDGFPPMELRIRRWRGDRLPNSWPTALVRSAQSPWPWQGVYPDGTFRKDGG